MKQLFTLLLVLVCTAVGTAQTVTYEFSGVISTISKNTNNAIPGVYLNQPFSGQVSYSQMSTNAYGSYNQKGNISFTIGSLAFNFTNDDLKITVENSTPGYLDPDYIRIYTYSSQNGYCFGRTGLELKDSSKTVFTDKSLPMSLNLSKFDTANFNIYGGKSLSSYEISMVGTINSLTLVPVPEPASAAILIVGSILMAVKRRGKRS